ncbi:MAG: outer membrane lipoprotein-sorting protein [Thermodesulfobacteriota bacterium]|nr:outer membrane lipoprotein-sorting protein [Thermodesulfobacteriota bacterium]
MKNIKKKCLTLVLIVFLMLPFATPCASADDPEARAIMGKVDARDDGDNQISDMEMILIDKKGKERVRKIHTFSKDKGEDTLKLIFFQHPADVKNTSFLTYDYDDPDKDDDQWLYLPALRKTKRIASTDKSGSFMGSDLTYSDMTSRNLEDYDYTFYEKFKEKTVNGVKTWVIWSVARSKDVIEKTGYEKSLIFVRQDNFFVIRALNWVRDGGYLKYMDVKKLDLIDGIWVATEMHITKKKGGNTAHKTILKLSNVKFNQGLEFDMFTVRRMEKGL